MDAAAPAARRNPWPGRLLWVLVFAAGCGLRVAWYDRGWSHPDEPITAEVVGYMRRSGDWDTNWAKANLGPDLKYDQYNFSSYLYAVYFFYRGTKLVPGTEAWRAADGGWYVYRFFSVVLAAGALALTASLARRTAGPVAGLVALAFAAVLPLLVQDAHFARPEAFLTLLTLGAVACCWPAAELRPGRLVAAAFLVGLLAATKITLLMLAWLPLVPLAAARTAGPARWRWLAAFPFAAAAGFALGAPGAVANPAAFLHGLRYLSDQYSGLHLPHSHLDGGPVADWLAGYFAATLGWPGLAAIAGGIAVLAARRQFAALLLLAGPVALFAALFASRSVFFERNLSPVLPLAAVLAGIGVAALAARLAAVRPRFGPALAAAVTAILLIAPLRFTGPLLLHEFSGRGAVAHDALERELRARHPEARWLSSHLVTQEPAADIAVHFRTERRPVLLRATLYPDDATANNLADLRRRFEMKVVAEDPGSFPPLPPCTLHTYHSAPEIFLLVTGPKSP